MIRSSEPVNRMLELLRFANHTVLMSSRCVSEMLQTFSCLFRSYTMICAEFVTQTNSLPSPENLQQKIPKNEPYPYWSDSAEAKFIF